MDSHRAAVWRGPARGWKACAGALAGVVLSHALGATGARGAAFELDVALENPAGSLAPGMAGGDFGAAIVTTGANVLVTAPGNTVDRSDHEALGAVYQYEADGARLIRELATPGFGGGFATVVAVHGNVLFGVESANTPRPAYGAVIHTFDLGSGRLRTILPPAGSHGFGPPIAFADGGWLVSGLPSDDETGGFADVLDPMTGEIRGTIHNPTPAYGDRFGAAVFSGGAYVLVAASGDDTAGVDAGAAYLVDPTTGAVVQTLLNPEPAEDRLFPHAVLAQGSRVIIGAPCSQENRCFARSVPCLRRGCSGAVHAFDAATGALVRTYRSPRPTDGERFGTAIASRGADLLISAPEDGLEPDAVYLIDEDGRLLHTFQGPDLGGPGDFGISVAAVGADVWVGAHHDRGRVYVFASTCGNGRLDPGESCDDGNTSAADGCAPDCRLESCGDGRDDLGEGCDDGNMTDGDGCDINCSPTGCGNDIVTGGEQCDDGNVIDGDGCDAGCIVSWCGNGVAGANEACDDGNDILGDGCDTRCGVEACGNGLLDAGESCDDGNRHGGDGCSARCRTGSDGGDWLRLVAGISDRRQFESAFGQAMTLLDGRLYVGQRNAVKVFDPATGTQLARLDPPDEEAWFFGESLAAVGASLLVGASHTANGPGAAYVVDPTTGALRYSTAGPAGDCAATAATTGRWIRRTACSSSVAPGAGWARAGERPTS